MQALHYNPVAYDTLPDLIDAEQSYTARGLGDAISGPIRDLSLQHPSIAKKFGIQLLHRHLPLSPNERLVERGHVSMPWVLSPWRDPSSDAYDASDDDGSDDDSSATTVARYGGRVVPRIFRLLDGVFAPVEFTWEAAGAEKDAIQAEEMAAFLPALAKLLVSLGVSDALGLRERANDDAAYPVEVQQGRANIMFPPGSYPEKNLVEVFWSYAPDEEGGLVLGTCGTCPMVCYHGRYSYKLHENAVE